MSEAGVDPVFMGPELTVVREGGIFKGKTCIMYFTFENLIENILM